MKSREKIKELKEKLEKYEKKLAKKKLGYGEIGRSGSGHSYSDQLRDDCNALEVVITSIKEEIKELS